MGSGAFILWKKSREEEELNQKSRLVVKQRNSAPNREESEYELMIRKGSKEAAAFGMINTVFNCMLNRHIQVLEENGYLKGK